MSRSVQRNLATVWNFTKSGSFRHIIGTHTCIWSPSGRGYKIARWDGVRIPEPEGIRTDSEVFCRLLGGRGDKIARLAVVRSSEPEEDRTGKLLRIKDFPVSSASQW